MALTQASEIPGAYGPQPQVHNPLVVQRPVPHVGVLGQQDEVRARGFFGV